MAHPHTRKRRPSGLKYASALGGPETLSQDTRNVDDNLNEMAAQIRALEESIPEIPEIPDYTSKFADLEALIARRAAKPVLTKTPETPRLFAKATNVGDTNLYEFGVGIVQGQEYEFDSSEFQSKVLLEIAIAGADEEEDAPFVVCMEDILIGDTGKVCLMGVVPVYLYGEAGDEALTFARVQASSAFLRLDTAGAAEVFERDTARPITEAQLALIRFSGAGGSRDFVSAANIAALNAVAGDYTPPQRGYTEDDGHYWLLNDDSTAWWSDSHSI